MEGIIMSELPLGVPWLVAKFTLPISLLVGVLFIHQHHEHQVLFHRSLTDSHLLDEDIIHVKLHGFIALFITVLSHFEAVAVLLLRVCGYCCGCSCDGMMMTVLESIRKESGLCSSVRCSL
jgi:hypothetical protein